MTKITGWNRGRVRGLKKASERIGDLVKESKKLLKNKKKIRVLEIGCGYGRALMELKKKLGNKVEIHGVNLEPNWNLALVKKYGLTEKIFAKNEIDDNLPKIHIEDIGKKTALQSDSFDLIYSQAAFQYVHDKAKAIEEINRLLTKDGKAIIELQELKSTPPAGYKELFDIWEDNKRINPIKYLRRFTNINAKRSRTNKNWHVLTIKKAKKFKLGLKLITSFDLHEINSKWWGTKAIYKAS